MNVGDEVSWLRIPVMQGGVCFGGGLWRLKIHVVVLIKKDKEDDRDVT